jgi:phage shock protein C
MSPIHDSMRREGLVRPQDGRIIGGVCAGLGRRFGMDPWAARLLFVLILMVIPGTQIAIYPILWILMPAEADAPFGTAPFGTAPSATAPFDTAVPMTKTPTAPTA